MELRSARATLSSAVGESRDKKPGRVPQDWGWNLDRDQHPCERQLFQGLASEAALTLMVYNYLAKID